MISFWIMMYGVVTLLVVAGMAMYKPQHGDFSAGMWLPAGVLWPVFLCIAIGYGIAEQGDRRRRASASDDGG